MLPSESRLKQRSAFGRVYSKGRSYATDLIVVYTLPNKTGRTRFGFSVSGKLGKAVVRNRVRRVLREAARELAPRVRGGLDVVVIARRRAVGAGYAQMRDSLAGLLRKSGAYGA